MKKGIEENVVKAKMADGHVSAQQEAAKAVVKHDAENDIEDETKTFSLENIEDGVYNEKVINLAHNNKAKLRKEKETADKESRAVIKIKVFKSVLENEGFKEGEEVYKVNKV